MHISSDDKRLQYCGRIDFDDPKAPVLVYAASSVCIRFRGTKIAVKLKNKRAYWSSRMGYILDGQQNQFLLSSDQEPAVYPIAENLDDTEHTLLLFKRMDSCHIVTFLGFELEDRASVLMPPLPSSRKIEVFGDSVSCGEVSEAVEYVGKPDPEHDGEYSNSWYSYAWMAARKLNAQLHDTSQGGIALLDRTGWFRAPDYLGIESCYDKIEYQPELSEVKQWDFARYTPNVVILAFGQNDNHPYDYMAEDYNDERAKNWRSHYQKFLEHLMQIYPKATFILTTTILEHHENWDISIEEVCRNVNSPRVYHFLYSNNGKGTPGHIRIPEAEQMSDELVAFINRLGKKIWK